MKNAKPVLGLTMGDPAGIGPEICLRALREPAVLARCVPVLFGDAGGVGTRCAGTIASDEPAATVIAGDSGGIDSADDHRTARSWTARAIDAAKIAPGKVSAACGRAGYIYIEQAIRAALAGKIDGVVTAPIHKESLNLAGVKFPGHTEIFTALTGAKRSCMMLYSDKLTVSMVTTHIGYHEVPAKTFRRARAERH